MKVTICELSNDQNQLASEWQNLAAHVKSTGSQFVLLPEMPFYPWWMLEAKADGRIWEAAVTAHEAWQKRFGELSPACVLTSVPTQAGDTRFNEGILWENFRRTAVHQKYYLPDELGFRESSWYSRGDENFRTVTRGEVVIGYLICSELWSFESASRYGKLGANVIVSPRATQRASLEKWIVAGRAAALVSGAFSVSSNRRGATEQGIEFGGTGWVIDPDGKVLGTTSRDQPFVTVELDLDHAKRAKRTYPRNLFVQVI